MTRKERFTNLANEHGFRIWSHEHLESFCMAIRKQALEDLRYEFESHDYFSEARKVQSFIDTEE